MIPDQNLPAIVVAYACSPGGSSEHGLGWEWVKGAAEDRKVVLITRPDRAGLPERCDELGVELCEVAVPDRWRRWTQGLGDLGIWLRVYAWARVIRAKIAELSKDREFAYAHLVTFHSIWMPYMLEGCRCTKVWGPVSGGEYVPKSYLNWIGPERWKEVLRNGLNMLMRRGIARRAREYDLILYGNSQTERLIETTRHGKHRLVLPNTVAEKVEKPAQRFWKPGQTFRLTFVGSCQGRRGLPLMLEALSRVDGFDWSMDIAGTGQALEFWKKRAASMDLEHRVSFHGWVGKDAVDEIYQRAHAFAFPTVRDGGGSGMLEAIERGLPVLALDWGGPSDVIKDTGAGVLFPVATPEETIQAMVNWFSLLCKGDVDYSELIESARSFDFSRFHWSSKLGALRESL